MGFRTANDSEEAIYKYAMVIWDRDDKQHLGGKNIQEYLEEVREGGREGKARVELHSLFRSRSHTYPSLPPSLPPSAPERGPSGVHAPGFRHGRPRRPFAERACVGAQVRREGKREGGREELNTEFNFTPLPPSFPPN